MNFLSKIASNCKAWLKAYLYKRKWNDTRRVEFLRMLVSEDNRWMYHDETVRTLTNRYLELLGDDWAKISVLSSRDLRRDLRLDPNTRSK